MADQLLRVDRMPGSGRVVRPARATIDDLRAASVVRRPARASLAHALADARDGVASVAETDLRLVILTAGLPEPDLDVDIRDGHGAFVGCSEMVFRAQRVVVEYEGDHHRTQRAQWHRDIVKYEAYAALGLTVVRVTAADLYPSAERALCRIRNALTRSGWRP